jgi:hypothetical protein
MGKRINQSKNSLKDLKKKQASNGKLRSTTLYMLVGPLWAPHKYLCQPHTLGWSFKGLGSSLLAMGH